jgi:hypothetical protein
MTTSLAVTLVFIVGVYIVYRDLKRVEVAVEKLQSQLKIGGVFHTSHDSRHREPGQRDRWNGQDPMDYGDVVHVKQDVVQVDPVDVVPESTHYYRCPRLIGGTLSRLRRRPAGE